jgi:acetyl-CoA carboxylase carboxyltransferase component
MTHNKISGVAQFYDKTEEECFAKIRHLLSFIPQNNLETAPLVATSDDLNRVDEKLNSIVPENPNKAYNIKDVIMSLADNGEFLEYQPYYAENMVTGFARINGKSVGVIANQPNKLAGCLDINGSDKGAHFIRTCDAFNIPLLTLMDTPGFLPGTGQEYGGIIRRGSYIAMCSKHLGADVVLGWPTAEIAVMGPSGAANIIFRKEIADAKDENVKRQEKIQEYSDTVANPYIAAARGYLDDVIEPSQTRKRVINAFEMLAGKRETRPTKKHGNIPL